MDHRFDIVPNGFFACDRKMSGACTEGSLRPDGNRKSLKNHTLTLKTIACEKKMSIFSFFCCVKSKSDFRIRLNTSFRV